MLGLNDYLTTAVPNFHQTARSNLVQICTPEALVGRRIKHKFEIDGELGETKWYCGIIVHYNGTTKAYEIDEDEHCFFDITIEWRLNT